MVASFAGLTALVTGGSKGMGKEWARLLLRDGAHVVLWGRNTKDLQVAQKDLIDEHPESLVEIASVDIGQKGQLDRALAQLLENHQVDVLINNAGTVFRGSFTELPLEDHLKVMSVNLEAPIAITHRILGSMIKRNFGYIVNVSSLAGFIGIPNMAAYSATKWGLIGFSEAIRLELSEQGKSGIRILTYCPSYVQTGLFSGAKPPFLTSWLKPHDTVKRAYQALKEGKTLLVDPEMGRLITPLRGILPEKINEFIWRVLGVNQSSGS